MLLKNSARNRAEGTKCFLVNFLENNIENFSHYNTCLNHIIKVENWELVLPDCSVEPKDCLILVQLF